MRILGIFSPIATFLRYYNVFRAYVGEKTLFLVGLSLVTTLTEGLGIAIFFSYLQQLAAGPNQTAPTMQVVQYLLRALTFLGIPTTPPFVILAMLCVFCVRGIFSIATNGYQFYLYQQLTQKMTAHLVNAIAHMDYREYLKRNSGYFTHLVTKEIERTVTAYYQISALIPKMVAVGVYLVLSVRMEWRFTVLSVVFGLAITTIFRSVTKMIRRNSQRLSEAEGQLTSLAIQMIQSFKYLFSTSSADYLKSQIENTAKKAAHFGSRIGLLAAINPATSEPLIVAFISSCIYYQIEVRHGGIAELFVTIMFLYRVMRESTIMQGSYQTLMSLSGSVDRVTAAIASLSASREAPGHVPLTNIEKGIELRNVGFHYGEKAILRDINLQIPARAMVALVGESGSGKSTLADLICGTLNPASGDILIDGVNLREVDQLKFRAGIGYVTQEGVLFDDTVANNVSLWRYRDDSDGERRIWDALERANCASFVRTLPLGIHEPLGDRGVRLSGGQRQRICIARELYKQLHLLLLDEATSALDSESEQLVQASIDALKGTATIVLIAHRLSTIRRCDIVCVMNKGQIVEQGSFTELMERGQHFRRMLEMQSLAPPGAN